jgi:hypothetical protein
MFLLMWSVSLISSFETRTCNQLGTFLSSYHLSTNGARTISR